ncbi:hypothetical protein Q9L58_008708 [Maublancomyces gigas]|uniref:Uncharacterized protein n=1 Tax=Discina gigas TaxID=1032678 RepID=A0ABR3G908_9PEZI
MAEIGLIASIAGVTAIGLAHSKTIIKAIQGTANAPDAVRGLDTEINIIFMMLDALTESLNDGAKVPPGMPDIIHQLGLDQRRLSEIVERHLPVRANAMRQVFSQVKWMTHTGEVNHLRARIGRYQELLSHSVTITNGDDRIMELSRYSRSTPVKNEFIEKMEQSEGRMMVDSEPYLNVLPSERQETFIRRLYTKVMTDRLPL